MSIIIILVTLLAVYCLLGWILTRFGLKGLLCTRSFSKTAVFQDEEGELEEVGRNDPPMLIPGLRM